MKTGTSFIKDLGNLTLDDVPEAGGKGAALGEMKQKLYDSGISVPDGFVILKAGCSEFLSSNGIDEEINRSLRTLTKPSKIEDIQGVSTHLRKLIAKSQVPQPLQSEIFEGYQTLSETKSQAMPFVAVRSSAPVEDGVETSLAGMFASELYVQGKEKLREVFKRCVASQFSPRAISYKLERGLELSDFSFAVVVQEMVASDRACSGVMFTADVELRSSNVIGIEATYGIGEAVVQGQVIPDRFKVFKPLLERGKIPIIGRKIGKKEIQIGFNPVQGLLTESKSSSAEQESYTLSDDEVVRLARMGLEIENYFSEKAGKTMPMDIEWAKDGLKPLGDSGELFIVQARPITAPITEIALDSKIYTLKEKGSELVSGIAVGEAIVAGEVCNIRGLEEFGKFKPGQILVTDMTDPNWMPIMMQASAFITNRGGRTCHAAIVARELGVPCIVGTGNATSVLQTQSPVTVVCGGSDRGRVYEGKLKYDVQEVREEVPQTETEMLLHVGIPETAFLHSRLPNAGVGAARTEFVAASVIGIHPRALLDYEKLKSDLNSLQSPDIRGKKIMREELVQMISTIEAKTTGYPDKKEYFISCLSEGIAEIAAAFYPKPIFSKLSDFNTKEYCDLVGGRFYEPTEDNPMMGWRGACRYYHPEWKDIFGMECEAFRRVRENIGLDNVHVMVPFCRSPEEGEKVIQTMAEFGLVQGRNGFKVFALMELPVSFLLADQFAEVFDGFLIGLNDLSQFISGIDRDSERLADMFNPTNPAVKSAILKIIEAATKKGRKVRVIGQAVSTDLAFVEFLVQHGIGGIVVNPDLPTLARVGKTIAATENKRLYFDSEDK
jgi:pyruvate, water dikinase